jgi:8-oxo-dGTP pyrophosphatase MutT (NUDIX family)
LDPTRAPSAPRDAATIIVLRPGEGAHDGGELEVLCVRRHKSSGFLGGAVVFPGGKVDPSDADASWTDLVTALPARADGMEGDARALAIAACREALEEAGIVPILGDVPGGVEGLRARAKETTFQTAIAGAGVRLAIDRLVPWARWVTPTAEARRFDARFYLLELPAGQVASHDDHETTMSFWATPDEVLARSDRGEIFLAPPTSRSVELLRGARDLAGARAIAARQSLAPICPTFVVDDQGGFLALPGDPAHEIRDRRVDGPTRFVLRDGRFVSTDPPP